MGHSLLSFSLPQLNPPPSPKEQRQCPRTTPAPRPKKPKPVSPHSTPHSQTVIPLPSPSHPSTNSPGSQVNRKAPSGTSSTAANPAMAKEKAKKTNSAP